MDKAAGTFIDPDVINEMRRTPISLRDDRYEKGYVEALTLCLDLRGFSSFAMAADRRNSSNAFLEKYNQELLAATNGFSASYYKLLGDGAMLIWDHADDASMASCRELFLLLRDVVTDLAEVYGCDCGLAGALTLDELYKYEIFGECSGLKYRDYIGYGLNISFRLQSLAASGELLAAPSIERRFKLGSVPIGPDRVPARGSIKGLRDEDYEGIVVIEPPKQD